MKKEGIHDISNMKEETTLNMGEDIRAWIKNDKDRTVAQFAELAGLSKGSIERIIYYDGTGEEPNWTREIKEGIMKVLKCKAYYTKEHKIE